MIDLFGERAEGRHALIVRRRKPAADIEKLEIVATRLCLCEYSSAQVQGLDKILRVGALAPDVK